MKAAEVVGKLTPEVMTRIDVELGNNPNKED
jgi:hypothetical protein